MGIIFKNDKIKEAREFAFKYHEGQSYGPHPYSYHLEQAANVGREVGLDEDDIMACYLHDVLEDTECRYSELRERFGAYIANCVYNCTDELGKNRKDVKTKTFKKLKGSYGVKIKLCDRIANIRYSRDNSKKKCLMYIEEDELFQTIRPFGTGFRFDGHFNKLWRIYDIEIGLARQTLIK